MSDLKQKILDYLAATPGASDTVQGITEWWLLEQRIREALSDVQRAVSELLSEGRVRMVERGDGLIRYSTRVETRKAPSGGT